MSFLAHPWVLWHCRRWKDTPQTHLPWQSAVGFAQLGWRGYLCALRKPAGGTMDGKSESCSVLGWGFWQFFSKMRPCLAVWHCSGEFKKKILEVGWERSSLKWFYSSRQILLNKEYLIAFSQRSGNLCPYIRPEEHNWIALRIGRPRLEGIWNNWNTKSVCSPLSTTNAGSQFKVKVIFLFCSGSFVREKVVLAPGISSSSLAFHYICCFVCWFFFPSLSSVPCITDLFLLLSVPSSFSLAPRHNLLLISGHSHCNSRLTSPFGCPQHLASPICVKQDTH